MLIQTCIMQMFGRTLCCSFTYNDSKWGGMQLRSKMKNHAIVMLQKTCYAAHKLYGLFIIFL